MSEPGPGAPPPHSPWRTHTIPADGTVEIRLGPLTLGMSAHAGEVHLTQHHQEESATPSLARFAPAAWDHTLILRPDLPDRPVVIAPKDPFRLLAGAEARVYLRLPLVAVVELPGEAGRPTALARFATLPYSDTWWGGPMEGELCHWLTTRARRALGPDLFEDHLAICPLQLVNHSESDLDVEKFLLQSEYLSLYGHEGRLWSDETRVHYRGVAEGSTLDVSGAAPPEEPDARLVTPPRERMARGFSARTFARLRSLDPWDV